MTRASPAPIAAGEFACAMAPLAPFEPAPHLAVAVSGGRDSLALALLAHGWARRAGGRITALTVDHGLRRDAAAEARRVGRWLTARGIDHRILRWRGPRPAAGIQEAAREARYGLLAGWCRRHAAVHLLLGHQREDQAETLLLRLGRGSGVDGLAAMAAVSERAHLRVLRPLLDVPRARLAATLAACGQPWIDDPSNSDPAFARATLRAALPALAAEGLDVARLAATARSMGRARNALEESVAALLAGAATLHPAGVARLLLAPLAAAPPETGLRALGAVLAAVGGRDRPPRLGHLVRLHAALCAVPGAVAVRTLGGCRIAVSGGRAVLCREAAAAAGTLPLAAGTRASWDGRYEVRVGRGVAPGLELRRLGAAGWPAAVAAAPDLCRLALPAAARAALPAVWRGDALCGVPDAGYGRAGGAPASLRAIRIRHRPVRPLTSARFGIVPDGAPPISTDMADGSSGLPAAAQAAAGPRRDG